MNATDPDRLMIDVDERDHVRGGLDAPVVLVEYGDFECPYCNNARYILKELTEALPGTFALVFRYFPLVEVHSQAERCAVAAEAAGRQGSFWAMHDELFAHQKRLGPDVLLELATDLELQVSQFQTDLENPDLAARVRRDFDGGRSSGVTGTPTFFVNGRRHRGDWTYASLRAAIDHAAG